MIHMYVERHERCVGLILKRHPVGIGRAALHVYLHLWYVECHNRCIDSVS